MIDPRIPRRLALAAAIVAGASVAAAATPIEERFGANTNPLGDQLAPAIAVADDGRFVVVWEDRHYDFGDDFAIEARRFDADGVPVEIEMQVNTRTVGRQYGPAAAYAGDGALAIVWASDDSIEAAHVRGRVWSAAGTTSGVDFRVDLPEADLPISGAAIAGRSGPGFLVLWSSASHLYARSVTSSGTTSGPTILVAGPEGVSHAAPDLVLGPDGGALATWYDTEGIPPRAPVSVLVQRLSSTGEPLGEARRIDQTPSVAEADPSIAMTPSGATFVVWRREEEDSGAVALVGRRLAADGAPLDGEVEILPNPGDFRLRAPRAPSGLEQLVLADSGPGEESASMRALVLDPDGTPIGAALALAHPDAMRSEVPALAVGPGGRFAVAWQSDASLGDLSGRSILVHRFALGAFVRGTQSAPPGPHGVGDVVELTIELANEHPLAQPDLPGPELEEHFPASLEPLAVSVERGGLSCGLDAGALRCDGALPAFGEARLTVTARIASGRAGDEIAARGVIRYDGDGDGASESAGFTDDPASPGVADPTCIRLDAPVDPLRVFATGFECGSLAAWTEVSGAP